MLQVDWAVGEGEAARFGAKAAAEGANVIGTKPFRPSGEEAELFSDPQMEPLTVVMLGMTSVLFLRYLWDTVQDLRGGEILILDLDAGSGAGAGDGSAAVRRIAIGRARKVILKHAGKSETFEVERFGEIEGRILGLLGGK